MKNKIKVKKKEKKSIIVNTVNKSEGPHVRQFKTLQGPDAIN